MSQVHLLNHVGRFTGSLVVGEEQLGVDEKRVDRAALRAFERDGPGRSHQDQWPVVRSEGAKALDDPGSEIRLEMHDRFRTAVVAGESVRGRSATPRPSAIAAEFLLDVLLEGVRISVLGFVPPDEKARANLRFVALQPSIEDPARFGEAFLPVRLEDEPLLPELSEPVSRRGSRHARGFRESANRFVKKRRSNKDCEQNL